MYSGLVSRRIQPNAEFGNSLLIVVLSANMPDMDLAAALVVNIFDQVIRFHVLSITSGWMKRSHDDYLKTLSLLQLDANGM